MAKKYRRFVIVVSISFIVLVSLMFVSNSSSINSSSSLNLSTTASCTSQIYCVGEILHSIQTSNPRIFNDSKTFVDMPTKFPVEVVISNFQKLKKPLSTKILKTFLNINFGEEGKEFVLKPLKDYTSEPNFLHRLEKTPILQTWALEIHKRWIKLARSYVATECKFCSSSLIEVPNQFIIPGGRFRETYYWDTYFVQEGLLVSGMFETTKNILKNFMGIVDKFGFFPNGLRIYYLNRSQPPFLIQMVDRYIQATNDTEFLNYALPILEKEYNWWMINRKVEVQGHSLNLFTVNNKLPRPEAYSEDLYTVNNFSSDAMKEKAYANLATSAGWDFSTRWVINAVENNEQANLRALQTNEIVPIDLNSILLMNERVMAKFFLMNSTFDAEKSKKYHSLANSRQEAMLQIFFDKQSSQFYDFHLKFGLLKKFSPANWAGVFPNEQESICKSLSTTFDSLEQSLSKYHGLPTTFTYSGLQWDFPNAWPPLQYSTLQSLARSIQEAKSSNCKPSIIQKLHKMAVKLAQTYIDTVYCGWWQSGGSVKGFIERKSGVREDWKGFFYEKFSVLEIGETGDGGEYLPQEGFGWTNGIALWIIHTFADEIKITVSQTICEKKVKEFK